MLAQTFCEDLQQGEFSGVVWEDLAAQGEVITGEDNGKVLMGNALPDSWLRLT